MNKQDRKNLTSITEQLQAALDELTEMADAEREKYDNLPEGLQDSARGEALDEAATTLEDQVSALEDVLSELGELVE